MIVSAIYFRLAQTLGSLGTTSGSYPWAGFAVALGIIFLGESFDWSTLAGMALIVLSVIAVTVRLHLPRLKGWHYAGSLVEDDTPARALVRTRPALSSVCCADRP